MRYTVGGFQQDIVESYGLDAVDVQILRWIVDFFNTQKMIHKVEGYRIYFWVNYGTIIQELPILRISNKRVIARRFDRYVSCELMSKMVVKGPDEYIQNGRKDVRCGSFTYFSFNSERLAGLLGPDKN